MQEQSDYTIQGLQSLSEVSIPSLKLEDEPSNEVKQRCYSKQCACLEALEEPKRGEAEEHRSLGWL